MTYKVTTTASNNSRPIVTTSSGTTYYIDFDWSSSTTDTSSTINWITTPTYTVPSYRYYTTITTPGTTPIGSGLPDNSIDDLKKKFQEMEDWYAEKLCEMIGQIEEKGYEIDELKQRVLDLEETLRRLVDALVKANE